MVHVCDKLSTGNFVVHTEPSQRRDELGDLQRALYDMTLKIGDLLKEVSKTTEQMAAASQQLNSSSMESANAATSVAQSEEDAKRVMKALNGTEYKGRTVRCNDADEEGHGRAAPQHYNHP